MSEEISEKRLVIQDVIYSILQRNPSGTLLDKLEVEGQKTREAAKGRYIAVAKSEFITEGNKVFPTVCKRGFRIGIKYTINRGTTHWTIRMFPKEAEKIAKEMNVNIANHSTSTLSLSSLAIRDTDNSECCGRCVILSDVRQKFNNPSLQEEDIAEKLGLTIDQYNLANTNEIMNLLNKID